MGKLRENLRWSGSRKRASRGASGAPEASTYVSADSTHSSPHSSSTEAELATASVQPPVREELGVIPSWSDRTGGIPWSHLHSECASECPLRMNCSASYA